MECKKYNTIQARMAYQAYTESLPKCDTCPKCTFVSDRKTEKRVCMARREIVDNRVRHCPEWCPRRAKNR